MEADSSIVIAGYGRSGTSLLVYLFTVLGYETGYTDVDCKNVLKEPTHAGLERHHSLVGGEVTKSPTFCFQIREYCTAQGGRGKIGHVIIPLRGSGKAAISRKRRGAASGGWWRGCETVPEQVRVNDEALGSLMDTIFKHDIPYTALKFPEFVDDVRGTFFKLKHVLKKRDIGYEGFKKAFLTVVDKGKIREAYDEED